MKNLKNWTIATCLSIVGLTACNSGRPDDSYWDTSTVTTNRSYPSGHPYATDQAAVNNIDSATNSASSPSSTTAGTDIVTGSTAKPTETVASRTRKTSRQGRIILAALNNNNSEKLVADRDGVYNRAEIMPSYPGGEKALRRFLERNIEYPEQALDNQTQGTIRVEFAIDEQGRVSNPAVISPRLGNGLEEEALRVVKQMPAWTPGQVKGKKVKTRFTLPITYEINDL